jgi:hypothetical protein
VSLEEVLASRRSALVLVVSGPKTGKGRLLREFRVRSASYPCRLIPGEPSSEHDALWLTVDKHTMVDEFRRATDTPGDAQAIPDDSTEPTVEVILIYGYRPQPDFHEWFVGTFIRGLGGRPLEQGADVSQLLGRESAKSSRRERARLARMIVVAGGASDLAELEPIADRRIVLGPLPRDAVVAELRRADAAIADHLEDGELEIYADAIVDDPSLLESLRALLPLTRPVPRSSATGAAS